MLTLTFTLGLDSRTISETAEKEFKKEGGYDMTIGQTFKWITDNYLEDIKDTVADTPVGGFTVTFTDNSQWTCVWQEKPSDPESVSNRTSPPGL